MNENEGKFNVRAGVLRDNTLQFAQIIIIDAVGNGLPRHFGLPRGVVERAGRNINAKTEKNEAIFFAWKSSMDNISELEKAAAEINGCTSEEELKRILEKNKWILTR